MKPILLKLSNRAGDLAGVEPLIALFLGAALLAVFLTAFLQSRSDADPSGKLGLLWTLYGHFTRLARALMLVALLAATISVLRIYLRQTVSNFQRTHVNLRDARLDTDPRPSPTRRPGLHSVRSGDSICLRVTGRLQ